MDITNVQILTSFFMWCTIINGALLIISSIMILCAADWAYKVHNSCFGISREVFNVCMYSSLGLFKIAFVICNLIPWIALLIIG